MIISFTHDVKFKKSVPNITIEGIPVEVVKHAKLLGVILSDDLTWNMHVDSIVKKAAYCQLVSPHGIKSLLHKIWLGTSCVIIFR